MKIDQTGCKGWGAKSFAAMLLVVASVASGTEKFVPSLQARTAVDLRIQGEENNGRPDFDSTGFDGPFAGTIRNSGSVMNLDAGSANAWAYAGYGVLGASASVVARSAPRTKDRPSESDAQALAGASFADELTITRLGPLTGGRGTLRVPWRFLGGWGGGLTGPFPRNLEMASADWSLRISTGTAWDRAGEDFEVFSEVIASGEFYEDLAFTEISSISEHRVAPGNRGFVVDSASNTGAVPPIWSELAFVFGVPFRLGVQLSIETQAVATNLGLDLDDPGYLQLRTADAFGEFGHTLRWGGVQQVLDANGNAVSDWTISAESGIDYAVANTAAVPEPSTWLSMLLGLLAIALRPTRPARRCVLDRGESAGGHR
ncbi:MAG: PEP-CTERM sorting domain-containing protein [Aquabacterium sp.]|nr:PEP-CTERM sorting domain-containing protein [Aquabacterium sp.]